MTLNPKIGSFMDFLVISGCDTSLYYSQGGATKLSWSRYKIWYLYINLAWTPQFSAKLLNRNCYRLSRVSWALAQISCLNLRSRPDGGLKSGYHLETRCYFTVRFTLIPQMAALMLSPVSWALLRLLVRVYQSCHANLVSLFCWWSDVWMHES